MNKNYKRYLAIFFIAFGTTSMYSLPYMKSMFYNPMQEALGLSHQQLGNLLSLYGIVAMFLYFPGGWLADRFSAKKLMLTSFVSSGLIGFYFATFPSYRGLQIIFTLWGVTTTLTFWAAAMKVIRMLGDSSEQGKMYGFNEGFSGVCGTVMSFIGLYFFGKFTDVIVGFKYVIWLFSIASIAAGIIVYCFVEEREVKGEEKFELKAMAKIMKMPKVWLIGLTIFSTYMIFSGMTYLNPYMKDAFKLSMGLVSMMAIIRTYVIKMGASPLAGMIVDKVGSATKVLSRGFIVIACNMLIFLLVPRQPGLVAVAVLNMLVLGIFIFGFRGIYFATVDEANIPLEYTGAVIGFASLIGFVPDAFFYSLAGGWIDNYGMKGYTYLFTLSLCCAIVGLISSTILNRIIESEKAAAKEDYKKVI